MDISRITAKQLTEDRLDASYYGTRYLENDAFLRSCGVPMAPVGTLTDKCNCGATPKEVAYDGKGTGLVRTTDVRPNVFLAEGVLRTSELRVQPDANVAAVSDDLLYTMSGTIGYAAVIPETHDVFSFSNTIARARLSRRSGQDPRFTAAFFNCKYGYTQSLRLVSGGIQGHVMPNPFKRLPVPTPDSRAQKYIGNTIKQADRLRARAERLESAARRAVVTLILSSRDAASALEELKLALVGRANAGSRLAELSRRAQVLRSRVSADLLFGRLNAEAYQEEYLENDRILRASEWPMKPLGELVAAPINNSIRGVTEHLTGNHLGVPMFRPADIDGLWMSEASAPRIDPSFEQEHAKARVLPGDIVLAIAGTVAAVGRIGETVSHGNINGSSARIRLADPLRGFGLFFLESEYGRRSLMRLAVGSVQKHLNLEDLHDVRVPVPEPAQCAPFEQVLALSGRARRYAADLLTASTQLVEGLIDGAIKEADLVEAARSMDAEKQPADAALLRKLKAPHDGRPLFPDVEALFDAIIEAGCDVEGGD